jgi:predicted RNA-binding protein
MLKSKIFWQSAYRSAVKSCFQGRIMCEFNVIMNGKIQFKDVVYAKAENGNVVTKNVLGEAKIFENCHILEVDVNSAKLMLNKISGK